VIATWSQPHSENERQQSVNDFVCCTMYNPRAALRHLSIIEVLAAFIGNMVCVDAATPQASMEPPQCLVLSIRSLVSDLLAAIHNQCIANHYVQKSKWHGQGAILTISVNSASTEGHQLLVMQIGQSRHRMDIWAYNWTTDLLPGQKYESLKEKHELKYSRCRYMQNIQNVITGCQMIDFDWLL